MARTPSEMIPLGQPAAPFRLQDPAGKTWSLDDFTSAPGLLVAFICNHCPYVKHLADELAAFGREYGEKGLAVVAINANDYDKYPDDAPPAMLEEARLRGYTFPYLVDETGDVAKSYGAACTPDFFLFDSKQELVYRGQFDSSRPGSGTADGQDLRLAADAVLRGEAPSPDQKPSIGCNIKWR